MAYGIGDAISSFSKSSISRKALMYPFSTMGTAATPDFWRTCLAYIEFLWTCSAPAYSSAIKSAIALNLTKLTYTNVEGEGELALTSKNTIERDLTPILGGMRELFDLGCDLMAYGNAFRSLYFPFTRTLICPQCKSNFNLKYILEHPDTFNFKYDIRKIDVANDGRLPMMGVCTCGNPDCNYRGSFYVSDILLDTKSDISIVSWRPQDIYIEAGSFDRKKCIYHYRPNAEVKSSIEKGQTLTLLTYPMALLHAVAKQASFQFSDGELFHLRDSTLSGVLTYGWGIPRSLSHFQLIWQLACLYKINEAIAVDYSVPKRLITPAPRAGASDGVTADPAGTIDLLPYLHQVKQMWETNDQAQVSFLPFPVQYQLLGGEAKNLVPSELLQMAEDMLLSVIDVPAELYRNTLAVDGAPLALTIFQNKWAWFRAECENFLYWLSNKLTPRLGWSPVKLGILPLKLDADIERATLNMQLALNETISWTSALDSFGHNYLEEQRRKVDESKAVMAMQKEMEQQGQLDGMMQGITMSQDPASAGQQPPPPDQGGGMGGMPMGGDPMAGGGMSPQGMGMMGMMGQGMAPSDYEKMSPMDVVAMAQQFAQQAIQAGPNRRSVLNQLRNELPDNIYAAVKEELRKMDYEAGKAGKQQMAQTGQPPPPPM
jgi:hypothetical protein